MLVLVTGAAGFIGSHLCEALAGAGHQVRAVDAFTPYYDVRQKEANAAVLANELGIEVQRADLASCSLAPLMEGVDVVLHQAGQPGVRASWREGFEAYVEANILVTQRLLEASVGSSVGRFVYASSSSVYGAAAAYPTSEDDLPRPQSPYGVTKLAAEHLCGVYARNFGVSTVSLRYFTVFGPRQRPDMAMHRMIEAAIAGTPFPMFGDGSQIRDFTYVADVVRANVLAMTAPAVEPATVLNVAGGTSVSLGEVVRTVGELIGRPVPVDRRPGEAGDVHRTGGSTARIGDVLGWKPETGLRGGLARQVEWHEERVPARG